MPNAVEDGLQIRLDSWAQVPPPDTDIRRPERPRLLSPPRSPDHASDGVLEAFLGMSGEVSSALGPTTDQGGSFLPIVREVRIRTEIT